MSSLSLMGKQRQGRMAGERQLPRKRLRHVKGCARLDIRPRQKRSAGHSLPRQLGLSCLPSSTSAQSNLEGPWPHAIQGVWCHGSQLSPLPCKLRGPRLCRWTCGGLRAAGRPLLTLLQDHQAQGINKACICAQQHDSEGLPWSWLLSSSLHDSWPPAADSIHPRLHMHMRFKHSACPALPSRGCTGRKVRSPSRLSARLGCWPLAISMLLHRCNH